MERTSRRALRHDIIAESAVNNNPLPPSHITSASICWLSLACSSSAIVRQITATPSTRSTPPVRLRTLFVDSEKGINESVKIPVVTGLYRVMLNHGKLSRSIGGVNAPNQVLF